MTAAAAADSIAVPELDEGMAFEVGPWLDQYDLLEAQAWRDVLDYGPDEELIMELLVEMLADGEIKSVEGLWVTHYHYDHVVGNPVFPEATVIGHELTRERIPGIRQRRQLAGQLELGPRCGQVQAVGSHGRRDVVEEAIDRVDLEGGEQPMFDAHRNIALTFNGEIYNFAEVAKELGLSGKLRSSSDTEVLVEAWARWGPASLDRLVGHR